MKKNVLKKLLPIILVLAVMTSVLVSCTDVEEITDSGSDKYVQWELLDDDTLTDGERLYYRRKLDHGMPTEIAPRSTYVFYKGVVSDTNDDIPNSVESVNALSSDPDFVWIYLSGGRGAYVYFAEGVEERMSEFSYYNVDSFEINDGYGNICNIDSETARGMAECYENGVKVDTDVTDLSERVKYNVYAYDEYDFYRFTFGTVYEIDGKWYFLDYRVLENNHFNADGGLSYREGTVPLVPLDESLGQKIEEAEDGLTYVVKQTTYEFSEVNSIYPDVEYDYIAVIIFLLLSSAVAVCGLLIPTVFIALGLILPRIKRLGNPTYWYVISAIGALWILCSLILAILVIIAIILA